MGGGASVDSSQLLSNSKFVLGASFLSSKTTRIHNEQQKEVIPLPLVYIDRESSVNMDFFHCLVKVIQNFPIGTPNRWDKILTNANKAIASSNIESISTQGPLVHESLREILLGMYREVPPTAQVEITHLQKMMPILFDKHTYARGKRISQQERNDRCLLDESYSYGELDHETFASIFFRHKRIYGRHKEATFCDLGSGVGSLVYTAATIGKFKKCLGIENIRSLHLRAEKRLPRWKKLIEENKYSDLNRVEIEFRCKDIFHDDSWLNSSYILLHWTAFSLRQRKALADIMNDCKEGTTVIAFTHPVPSTSFIVLLRDKCETSWGVAHYFIQEKISTAQQ
jgi:hypothetical protein